jgi:hypothetical protein
MTGTRGFWRLRPLQLETEQHYEIRVNLLAGRSAHTARFITGTNPNEFTNQSAIGEHN